MKEGETKVVKVISIFFRKLRENIGKKRGSNIQSGMILLTTLGEITRHTGDPISRKVFWLLGRILADLAISAYSAI